MDKKYLTISAITFLTLFILGTIFLVSEYTKQKPKKATSSFSQQINPSQTTEQPSISPAIISFHEQEVKLSSGQNYITAISFTKLPKPAPTALTLTLTFDPNQIQVEDIQPGNLWTGENVLHREIDNDAGSVKYSVGQDFNDEVTNNTKMVQITFTSVGNQDTKISIAEGSVYTSVQEQKLIPMQGSPLIITME